MTDRRRDQNPYAPARESLIDRQVRDAMDDGAFDDLPYRGERLPLDDDSAAGDWALAHRMLRNAGMAPPWIETDKEARALLAAIDRALDVEAGSGPIGRAARRRALERLLDEANRVISRLNAGAPTDRQHRRPPDRVGILARFDALSR